VSFDLNVGVIPNGLFVCHTCDVRLCVRPEHLFLGSHQDNMNDMNAKGRGRPGKAYGELAHLAKLDWVKVREIRARYTGRRGEVASLAREYGISLSSMFAVVTGQTWRVDPCGSTIARVSRSGSPTSEHRRDEGDDAIAEEHAEREAAWREGPAS
jgi:hypothetical protein